MPFDAELRHLTEATARSFAEVIASGRTPPATYRTDRCRGCSLIDLCQPKATGKSALAYRARRVAVALGELEEGAGP